MSSQMQTYLQLLDELCLESSAGFQTIRGLEEFHTFLSQFECTGYPNWETTLASLFLIYKIRHECQCQVGSISINHQNSIINLFERSALPAMERLLPKKFHFLAVRKKEQIDTNFHANNGLLFSIVRILSELFELKILAANALLESVAIQYIVAILYSIFAKPRPDVIESCDKYLKQIVETFGTVNAFRFLIIVKGMRHLPIEIGKRVHKELIRQLRRPGGFAIFCRILMAHDENPDDPNWERYQSISKIVGAKGYTKAFYMHIVHDIVNFLRSSMASVPDRKFSQPCVVCLKQIYSLDTEGEVSQEIKARLFEDLEIFAHPPDVISGVILADSQEIHTTLGMLCTTFNGSIDKSTFPSRLLVPYVTLLFQMLMLTEDFVEIRNYIRSLLTLCLQNRTNEELGDVVREMLFPSSNVLRLHPRIELTSGSPSFRLQIGPEMRDEHALSESSVFVEMLRSSGNNPLMYRVFIKLLEMFELQLQKKLKKTSAVDDLIDEDIIVGRLNDMFLQRTILMAIICELLAHKPFHAQFKEHSGDVIAIGQRILERNIEQLQRGNREVDDGPTDIVLAIFNEFSNVLRTTAPKTVKVLQEYRRLCPSERINNQIQRLLDEVATSRFTSAQNSSFERAVTLCADESPPVKVEGIHQMIKLIEKCDPETVAFRHKILILTLDNLRDVESFVYLNSVLLLTALTKIMEEEVIDALIAEFTNVNSDTDLRLKVGEVLVKVVDTMGPLSYKYKDLLINTFLKSCQGTESVEFRTSCTSNLATVTRILSYQVHAYFNELIAFVEQVISHEQYVPLRRAAILTMTQLLAGMDKLVDLGDYVLQVYRLLKQIIRNDSDETTSLHAAVGLETLKVKTKDFLQPEVELRKEIQVLGIADETCIGEIKYK